MRRSYDSYPGKIGAVFLALAAGALVTAASCEPTTTTRDDNGGQLRPGGMNAEGSLLAGLDGPLAAEQPPTG